eukprot:m.64475 g.64475  ORF g.64475 m.64475 type:complete len:68 (+) comp13593_c0_seq1:238-441(+)
MTNMSSSWYSRAACTRAVVSSCLGSPRILRNETTGDAEDPEGSEDVGDTEDDLMETRPVLVRPAGWP